MSLFDEFKDYCNKRPIALVGLFALTIAFFGMWAFHHMVTFDAEGFYSLENGEKWYVQWIAIGRWAFVALKAALDVIAVNPYFATALFVLLLPLSALLWSFAFQRWAGSDQPLWVTLVFCTLYLSHPIWAQQFGYRNQLEVMSVALAIAPFGMLLVGEWLRGKGAGWGIAALAVATFEFGCYQSFIFMYALGICIFLFHDMQRESEGKKNLTLWRKLGMSLAFVVVAFALCWGISKATEIAFGVDSAVTYFSSQFQWGVRPAAENIHAIATYLFHSAFGNGIEFTALFAVEVFGLAFWIVAAWVRRKPWRGFATLIAFGIVLCPFLLEIVTAGDIVIRSQLAFVLAVSFLGMFELEVLAQLLFKRVPKGVLAVVIVVVAIIAVVPQLQLQSRLLYTDVMVMDSDRTKMEQVYYQAMQAGGRPGDAVCFVGGQSNAVNDTMVEHEVIGYSYFEFVGSYDGGKAIEAMQAYGFDVSKPTDAQESAARAEADSLEVWPSGGSISVHDGYYVVRLS